MSDLEMMMADMKAEYWNWLSAVHDVSRHLHVGHMPSDI